MSPLRLPAKRHKYGAVRTTVDDIAFDSKKEATRYAELKMLEKAGHISELLLQPEFPLIVASTSGQAMQAAATLAGTFDGRIGVYRADFAYYDEQRGVRVVEDVKGVRTAIYIWKKKHVEKQYGIRITEVS